MVMIYWSQLSLEIQEDNLSKILVFHRQNYLTLMILVGTSQGKCSLDEARKKISIVDSKVKMILSFSRGTLCFPFWSRDLL